VSPHPGFTRYDLGLLFVSLIWGANFSAIKYALRSIPPLAFSASRFALASLLFWIVLRVREGPHRLPRRTLVSLLVLGVIGNTGYQVAFMAGLARTTATNSSLIMGAMPVMVAGLATALGVERPGRRLWLGMALALLGVGLVIAGRDARIGPDSLGGDVLVLVACACWAIFTVGLRHAAREVSPLRVAAITTAAGTPGLLLLAGRELGQVPWRGLDAGTWFGLLYSGILAIGVAYVLWSYAVQQIGGSRTALYNCLVPVVAGAVAWIILGERPGPGQVLGAGLVVGGVLVSQTGPAAAAPAPRAAHAVPDLPD
jgi:drug/metabolite transporter (DMT)-like permease